MRSEKKEKEREKERERERDTDRQTDRQAEWSYFSVCTNAKKISVYAHHYTCIIITVAIAIIKPLGLRLIDTLSVY